MNNNGERLLDQSHHVENVKCTIMLVANLAYPHWISVSCTTKLLGNIFCSISHKLDLLKENISTGPEINSHVCRKGTIKHDEVCLEFEWHIFSHDVKIVKKEYYNPQKHAEYLFNKMQSNYIRIHIFSHDFENIFTIKKLLHAYNTSIKPVKDGSNGFILHTIDIKQIQIPEYLFQCKKGIYEIYTDQFYNKYECEINNPILHVYQNKSMQCPLLYYSTKDGNCKFFISLHKSITLENPYKSQKNDIRKHEKSNNDGAFTSPIGNQSGHLILDTSYTLCSEKGQFYCSNQQSKCFNFSDICHYKLNIFGNIFPCESGSHLANCTHFQCNMKYKCLRYHGIMCVMENGIAKKEQMNLNIIVME